MATLNELLADSLTAASEAAQDNIIQSEHLPRTHRERLLNSGWLTPIVRGWYMLGQPAGQGESAHWYASCWAFISQYLHHRFAGDYCLSADSSLDLHLDQNTLHSQVVVMSGKGGSSRLDLPHNTSMLMYEVKELPQERETIRGVHAMSLATALCRCSPTFFSRDPVKAEIALRMADVVEINKVLLAGKHTGIAARLEGAYRFLGDTETAQNIAQSMNAAGYRLRSENPFAADSSRQPILGTGALRVASPYAARVKARWMEMRQPVMDIFPPAPGPVADSLTLQKQVKALYRHDAYHSLSIEGFEVTPELVTRVREGQWNPYTSQSDAELHNALAAKGYTDAFDAVCSSLQKMLDAESDGSAAAQTAQRDIHGWYQALFSPGVRAGIIKPADLAGYRDDQVYLCGSAHVPPPKGALLDTMDTFFNCLRDEPSAAVRAVLGHFFFGFIHPYIDGNGRLARFLMNLMLVSAGYPWTIVRSHAPRRARYMQCLEQASVGNNIRPFTQFITEEMAIEWEV